MIPAYSLRGGYSYKYHFHDDTEGLGLHSHALAAYHSWVIVKSHSFFIPPCIFLSWPPVLIIHVPSSGLGDLTVMWGLSGSARLTLLRFAVSIVTRVVFTTEGI